jgi:predicted nucleic acid-binding protein
VAKSQRKPVATLVLVDSCGWLEYVTGGANADFFEAALLDTGNLIVPALCLYEVGKRMLITQGESAALEVLQMMQKSRVVQLAPDDYFAAAKTSVAHKLAMADALIWQTAQSLGATLYTQDGGLKGMNGVKFQSK